MNTRLESILASILVYFPISWASALGGYLGREKAKQGIKLGRKWVTRIHHNLEELQGVSKQSVREEMIVKHMDHIGRIYAEYPILHRLAAAGRFDIEGGHNLQRLNGPIICISAHTGHWELLAEVLKQHHIPGAFVYDPIENSSRLKIALKTRKTICPEASGYKYIEASKQAAKEVVKWLKSGGNLIIFGDEEVNSSTLAPAFSRDISYSGNLKKAVKLAIKYNMQIIPMHIKRTGNSRYTAVIETPIEPPSRGASQENQNELVDSLDTLIEKWVLEDICHWYWLSNLDLKKKF